MQILKESGRLDLLVNNAGITRDNLILRMKEEEWDAVLAVNLKGAYNCIRAVSKPMVKQRFGRIINISSVVGVMGNPGQANYVASKAGLIGLTKAVARELASRNITVNAVAPGFIQTEMTESLPDHSEGSDAGPDSPGPFRHPGGGGPGGGLPGLRGRGLPHRPGDSC